MVSERRRQILLAAVAVLLALAVYTLWPRTAATTPAASNVRGGARKAAEAPVDAPDVHIEALGTERPRPGDADRNLFRFRPPPAPPPASPPPPRPVRPAPSGPPPPPAMAPITLKFIGVMETTEPSKKIAVLSDARGVYHGREGDIIEGRYRILKIGTESIEMAYLDGRGRQTIRLTGGS